MFFQEKAILVLVVTLFLSGCAMRRYQPVPLLPTETALSLQARSLTDHGLRVFLEANLGHELSPWPLHTWDLSTLSLAALYFNPTLDVARARSEEARAAIKTAATRPNPSLSLSPGIPSPYLLTLDFAAPIETAGKRGYRIQSARDLDQAARFDLADSAWKVRSGVRNGLLNYLLASRALDLLRTEERTRTDQVKLLEQRLAVGEIPTPEVDLARIEFSMTHLAINAAQGQKAEAKAALAASVGIPAAALERLDFSWSDFDSPPSAESLSQGEIQRDAVLNRLDVRRSLARYAAAQADLQLEVAKQYPDVQIGPGYTYEEKNNFFTVGLSVTIPVFNRNQGPIAEAEARRKEVAAVFLETQAHVIGQSEQALEVYSSALKELAEADQFLRKLQDGQLQMMQRAVSVGEEDRLALNGAQLQSSVIARARLDALARAQNALGALEDAVQRPLDPGDTFSMRADSPSLNKPPAGLKP